MARSLLWLVVAGLAACEAPTDPPDAPPIPWTPTLEAAAGALDDPLVADVVTALPTTGAAAAVRLHVGQARAAATRRDAAAVDHAVRAAIDALGALEEDAPVHADVLLLVLDDVRDRFGRELVGPSSRPDTNR